MGAVQSQRGGREARREEEERRDGPRRALVSPRPRAELVSATVLPFSSWASDMVEWSGLVGVGVGEERRRAWEGRRRTRASCGCFRPRRQRCPRSLALLLQPDPRPPARPPSSTILAWTVQDKLVFPALLALALVVALVVVDHEPDKLLPAARLRLSLAHLAGTAMPVKPQAAYLDQLARDKRDFVAALDTSTSTRDWVVAVGNEAGGALLLHSLSLRPRGSLPDLGSHTQTSTRSRPPSPTPTLPPSASPPRPRAALSPSSSPPAPICTSAPRTSSPSRPQASRATSSSPSTTSPRPRPRLPPPSPPAPASPSSTTTRSSPPSAPTRPTRPTRPTTRASHPSSTTTPTRGGTSARARAGSR